MNATLQKHGAKHVYKVPEGLRELCTDISREVLRLQPDNLYDFIAEYVDTLLITRENTKIAVKVVNNILLGSQAILSILYRAGFTLEQIAVAAPRIQRAFREYLDAVDMQPVQICEDYSYDDQSMVSIRSILEATGSTREDAERAATVIQAAFRGHYERMVLNEAQGKVQWQRAVTNTLDILRKAGATQAEISKAVGHLKILVDSMIPIFSAEVEHEPLKKDMRILEPAEAIQAVAWMDMMYEDSGMTLEKANEAASIIQRAYKQYRTRRGCYDVQKIESSKSLVVEAILDTMRHRVFEKVASREDVPSEYGTRQELMITSKKVELTLKEHLRKTRLSVESSLQPDETDAEEEFEDEEMEEPATEKPDAKPQEPEPKPETDHVEEQAEEKDEVEEVSEDGIAKHLPTSPELEMEAEEPEAEQAEVEQAEVEPAEVEQAEVEPAEVEQAEAEELEAVEAEVEPAEVEPAEVEPAEVEPAEVEQAEVEQAEAEELEVEEAEPAETEETEQAEEVEFVEEAELPEKERTVGETEEQAEEETEEMETAEEEEPNVAQETSGTADAPAE